MDIEVIERMQQPTSEDLKGCPEGEVKPMVFFPDERLAQRSDEVTAEVPQGEIDKLVSDLATTMYMTGGMGLSAIQIGVPLRVFICDISAHEMRGPNRLLTAINPVLVIPDDSPRSAHREGCLSFPGVQEVVERPEAVVLRARDRHGVMYTLPASGVMARVVQHEVDHLDGKTFLDRMKPMAKANAEKAVRAFHASVASDTVRVTPPRPRKPPRRKALRRSRRARR